nr:immunoglobulin light chain junction region [Macaca mulatta]MOV93237.1 immunoglobulin light chain junction region [Macaca mulatta]MOV93670.1 immunoglobulin light chain junction region [Macaca mulatta]
CQHYNSLPFSF